LSRGGYFQPRRTVHAVDGVDLDVARGETVGLVGESGCGKSTLARVLIRIYRPDAGSIRFDGEEIAQASASEIRPLRKCMQMVFQDPYSSLNSRMTVGQILAEPLRFHGITTGAVETRDRVRELLAMVKLDPKAAARYPHEFSGGQRQRISIARALSVRPDFIIADEPISALDVNIQAQILNLMLDLQEQFGLTYLFIAHDLSVVRHISDRIVVLYLGKIMEVAPSEDVFEAPLHPYTRYLISAVPVADPIAEKQRQRLQLQGEPPSSIEPPSGCRFRTRCPIARAICGEAAPPLREYRPRHFAACYFAGEF
jgi:peptide/nickel transport system ATP-binding protein